MNEIYILASHELLKACEEINQSVNLEVHWLLNTCAYYYYHNFRTQWDIERAVYMCINGKCKFSTVYQSYTSGQPNKCSWIRYQ